MTTEIWLAIIAIVAAPVASALTAVLMRRKYRAEIDGLRADVDRKLVETRGQELENVRKASQILMDEVVTPLKVELKSLRYDLKKFRKAFKQIPRCPLADDCPVSRELLAGETDDGGHGTDDK